MHKTVKSLGCVEIAGKYSAIIFYVVVDCLSQTMQRVNRRVVFLESKLVARRFQMVKKHSFQNMLKEFGHYRRNGKRKMPKKLLRAE